MTDSPRVLCFESRRAPELLSLFERQGMTCTVAPSMREIPLEENAEVFTFADELLAGKIDWLLFMTGVGAEALRSAWETKRPAEELLTALNDITVFVRGPKPTAVLKKWRTRIDYSAPSPNTWREVLAVIDDAPVPEGRTSAVDGQTFAVQEYGRPNDELYDGLRERGATVRPVPVYRWALPEETGPLEEAIRGTIAGNFDWLTFTSAKQIEHVLEVAARLGVEEEFRAAAGACRVGSIGPTCSEALEANGFPVTAEASPPKMGQLVKVVRGA